MLFALRQPAVFLGLVLGFAVGMIAVVGATRLLDRNSRYSAPFWHPKSWLDPYSAVAALLAGVGWAPRPEVRRGFGRSQHRQLWTVAAISLLVPAALGAAGIAAYAAAAPLDLLPFMDSYSVLHGFQPFASETGQRIALGFGIENLAIAVLSVIPIPPLPTGVAFWTVVPRTPGMRQFAYRMLEEHWGIAALLVFFLIQLGGDGPLLLVLITNLTDAVIQAF
jgi:hypothetical protein